MRRSLPPLASLRAFESAARLLSFKRAAQELNVTAAAVSLQIKQLEDYLQMRLFIREHGGIRLSPTGELCYPKIEEGFECLREAITRVQTDRARDVLKVGAGLSFVSRWLVPRLHRFTVKHPQIDVRLSTSARVHGRGDIDSAVALSEERDIIVIFGTGAYPGLKVEKLLSLTVTPLCSPAVQQGPHPLGKPADLRHHTLLHDDLGSLYGQRSYWDIWLARAKVKGVDTSQGIHFTHAISTLEAAIAREGVACSTPVLASADIAAGKLIAPFALQAPIDLAYYVVSDPLTYKKPPVKLFRDWLMEEARAFRQSG